MTAKLTDTPVRESASEWASSTFDALQGQIQDQIPSAPDTPGLHVPGAFPGPYPKADVVQKDMQYVKDAATTAFQTAKEYVPTSVDEVKHLIENAGDTIGGYLPQSVATYLLPSDPNSQNVRSPSLSEPETHPIHHASFPSEASQNMHPSSSGGVGNLPGPPDEPGVAILPEERVHSSTSQYEGPNSEILHSETGLAILPEERHVPSHDDPPLATKNDQPLSTDGVGSLPGSNEEVGVALLPEERNSLAGSLASTDASTNSLRDTSSNKVWDRDSQYTLPSTGSPSLALHPSTADKNITDTHPVISNNLTTARSCSISNDAVKVNGVPSPDEFQKELPQELAPSTEKPMDEKRNLEQGQSDVATAGCETVGATATPDPTTYSDSADTVRKKPGFIDKLKGEVKAISSKFSHHHREAGKAEGKN